MRLKFHKGVVISVVGVGFIVTLMTIGVVSLFTSPEALVFIGPASLIWIILLVFVATRIARKRGES